MLTGFSIADVGPLGVFLLMVPESACLPVPSEITLLAAGFAVHQGRMNVVAAVAAATAGNLVGSLLAYAVGRLSSHWRLWSWAQAGLQRCDALLASHGALAVFTARLMPLARTFVSVPAGHARIPIARFIALTTLGCVIWASGFVAAGMLLGASWQHAGDALRIPLVLAGAATAAGLLLRKRRRKRQATTDERTPDTPGQVQGGSSPPE
jgi:membrane protein DedA with SNARE-associated domain